MNNRQRLFITEYVKDFNATAAYRRAGYSAKGRAAEVSASRLLRNAEVSKAIAAATASAHAKAGLSADRVIKQIERMVMYDPRKLFHADGSTKEITELDEDTAMAVVGVDVHEQYKGTGKNRRLVACDKKFKLADRLGAANTALKMLGRLTERIEHTGKDGGPIELSDVEIARRIAFILTQHTPR